jgi:hypothetical protein
MSSPSFGRRILDATFPKGSAWSVKVGGWFDGFLDGLGDNIDTVRVFLSSMANLRNPDTTPILSDLEREYGILTNTVISESSRRSYLAGIKFATPGKGSESTVEANLRAAGFDVRVIQNSPRIDPNAIINADFLMWASTFAPGTETNYAGYYTGATAPPYASVAGRGGGDLVVNNPSTVALYSLPADDHRWNFVFWIGESFTGTETFTDWNMDAATTGAWTSGGGALLEKLRTPRQDVRGLRSMRVTEPDEIGSIENVEPVQPDASLVAAYQFKDVAGVLESVAWENQLADGSMEATGVASWTVYAAAVLTKQGSAYSGDQCMRATYSGTNFPGFDQSPMTIGREYRVTGYARSDGVAAPRVYTPTVGTLWTGTTSREWQGFDIEFTAANALIRFYGLHTSAGYIEFDHIHLAELSGIADQDMEEPNATSPWTNFGGAVNFGKLGDSPKQGVLYVFAESVGIADPAVRQNGLVIGRRYQVRGWARSDGNTVPRVLLGSGTVAWTGTTDQVWQRVDFVDVCAGDTWLYLQGQFPGASRVDFDGFDISPALDIQGTNTVAFSDRITQYGESGQYNGATQYTDLGTDARFNIDRRFTIHAVVRIDSVAATDYIWGRRNALANSYNLYIDPADATLKFIQGNGVLLSTGFVVTAGVMYDLAFVVDTTGTNYELYVNGVLEASAAFSAFQLNAGENLWLAAKSGAGNLGAVTFAAFEFYDEAKSATQVAGLYASSRRALEAGAYAEQLIDTVTDSRPLAGWAYGDGDGGIPCVLCKNPATDHWEYAWIGTDAASGQTISATLPDGCSGIRLYSKIGPGTDRVVSSIFDNMTIYNLGINAAQIPAEQRAQFEKIILQAKPIRSWAAVVADYI